MSPVTSGGEVQQTERPPGRRRELVAFLFLTVVLAPVLAIAIVGGFGFVVWIYQMIYGPPGPPTA
jgi:nitrate reductase NapE